METIILFFSDHLRCYRKLNQLKRRGVRPDIPNSTLNVSPTFAPNHNSTMELMVKHCPSPGPLVADGMYFLNIYYLVTRIQ